MFFCIALIFLCVCAGVTCAGADEKAAANKLFVETVQLLKQAAAAQPSDAVGLYEKALRNLDSIVANYPGSDLAVQIISGQAIGQVSRRSVEMALDEARQLYEARQIIQKEMAQKRQAMVRGTVDAPVVIKEFSDYSSPYSARLQGPLERAMQQFAGKVQLILYPFALIPTSEVATQAAWCAGEQGKFWEFHHMLYRRQELWHRLAAPLERLREFAKDLNLDTAALKSCVESGRMQSFVKEDKAYGEQLAVDSVPTLFINTYRVVGAQPEGDLVRLIGQELNRVQRPGQ